MFYIKKWTGAFFLLVLLGSLAVFLTVFHLNRSQLKTAANGVNLDIARKFYSPQAIKLLINQVSENGGSYIQLHLSDNENVAIELEALGQTEEQSEIRDGIHYNRKTNQPFLTKKEMTKLIQFANEKGIKLIPDFDTPGHFEAAAQLLRINRSEIAKQVLDGDQLAYETQEGLAFARELYGELAKIFAGQQALVIGGDEFDDDQKASNPAYVHYVNTLSNHLAKQGIVTRIWNDTVLKKDLANLKREHLQIIYWSLNGDANDKNSDWDQEVNRYRRKNRTTLTELEQAGFDIINANSYYLYSVPKQTNLSDLQENLEEEVSDTLNYWEPEMWNGIAYPTNEAPSNRSQTKYLIGSLYSIWGEEAQGLSDIELIKAYEPAIKAFFKRAN
ncbi:family 20 glycosylhydrolase [Streptococcus dentiloxodontae]